MANPPADKVGAAPKAKSNTQQAVRTIKQMILENQLPAGSSHLESELAEKLRMSRTPVREATLILEAQGLLEVRPRHGVKIVPLSVDDMREIYQILTVLESLSARLAAKKRFPEEEFEAAEAAIRNMDIALETDNREAWAQADETFHRELLRLGGNKRIATICETYNDQARRARALTLYMRPSPTKSNDDHRRVLEAIRNGDFELAQEIHTLHRVQAMGLIIDLLEKYKLHAV
ncbi:MAG: GntR family transcriptional regulator [Hyphomicrobiales bacterium]|nr:GntR family transcriptional regulator [Hyphomicrobiales bacterium]